MNTRQSSPLLQCERQQIQSAAVAEIGRNVYAALDLLRDDHIAAACTLLQGVTRSTEHGQGAAEIVRKVAAALDLVRDDHIDAACTLLEGITHSIGRGPDVDGLAGVSSGEHQSALLLAELTSMSNDFDDSLAQACNQPSEAAPLRLLQLTRQINWGIADMDELVHLVAGYLPEHQDAGEARALLKAVDVLRRDISRNAYELAGLATLTVQRSRNASGQTSVR